MVLGIPNQHFTHRPGAADPKFCYQSDYRSKQKPTNGSVDDISLSPPQFYDREDWHDENLNDFEDEEAQIVDPCEEF
jgi:hypothetical protein